MAIQAGPCEVEILDHTLRSFGDKSAVSIRVKTDEQDDAEVLIFLTAKSMNIARAQLKRCGFDVDARDLGDLVDNPHLLAGRRVGVRFEEWKGNLRPQIDISGAPPKDELERLTASLRAAKSKSEGPSFADDPPPPGDEEIPF
jgi:hypothetical protein